MESDSRGDITELLAAVRLGKADATAQLAERVFDNLRRIARGRLRHERPHHTLEPTELVNEVFMQLVAQSDRNWQNRSHFFAVAAQLMRRVLIDYARTVKAKKRGGVVGRPESLDLEAPGQAVNIEELLSVDQALKRLEEIDPRQGRVVELRYFAGMTEEEVAEVLQVSVRTVKRDWNMARSFLHDEMSSGSAT